VKIHDLKPAEGSNRRRKRVGRGIGGKGGKTAGRGTKGQKARGTVPVSFEGGQLPMNMRVPKLRGFNNPFRVEYQALNLDTIEASDLTEVSPETLLANGLVSKGALVKVLGRGELSRAVTVKAHAFSKSAEADHRRRRHGGPPRPAVQGASCVPRERAHQPLICGWRYGVPASERGTGRRLPFQP
jgi:large subunit ribosomal protein L15